MTAKPHADNLHRLVKYALDSGEAKSLDEAESLFQLSHGWFTALNGYQEPVSLGQFVGRPSYLRVRP